MTQPGMSNSRKTASADLGATASSPQPSASREAKPSAINYPPKKRAHAGTVISNLIIAAGAVTILYFFIRDDPGDQALREQEVRYAQAMQDLVKAHLDRPETAKFSNVYLSQGSGVRAICGTVSAVDRTGARDSERFVAGGASTTVGLEEDFAPGEFDIVWNKVC